VAVQKALCRSAATQSPAYDETASGIPSPTSSEELCSHEPEIHTLRKSNRDLTLEVAELQYCLSKNLPAEYHQQGSKKMNTEFYGEI